VGIWWEFGGNLKQENGKEMGGVVGFVFTEVWFCLYQS
jgi:hypothetical protein